MLFIEFLNEKIDPSEEDGGEAERRGKNSHRISPFKM